MNNDKFDFENLKFIKKRLNMSISFIGLQNNSLKHKYFL